MTNPFESQRLILVTGPSGAGKTVLSNALVETLGDESCVRIAMDDYYLDNRDLPVEQRQDINFDHPEAIDWALLEDHLAELLAGRAVEKPCYDFVTHTRHSHTETVTARPHVVLDGIHAMARETLVRAAKLTVFVDATRNTCATRRRLRDMVERGRSEESVREQFARTVWPMAERFILPQRERADLIVSGTDSHKSGLEQIQRLLGLPD